MTSNGVSVTILLSMISFAVNDCLDATRHAGYQRFAILLGDFSDPNYLNSFLRFSALDG